MPAFNGVGRKAGVQYFQERGRIHGESGIKAGCQVLVMYEALIVTLLKCTALVNIVICSAIFMHY